MEWVSASYELRTTSPISWFVSFRSQNNEDLSAAIGQVYGEEAGALAEGLQMHVNQLTGAFDSYTMGDYEAGYSNIREAYEHRFTPGKALSGAISFQFLDKFSQEMLSDMTKTGPIPQDTGMDSIM